MDHDLELFIPILEILEIEVCNILQNPGNIGKRIFPTQSYPGNIGKHIFPTFSTVLAPPVHKSAPTHCIRQRGTKSDQGNFVSPI